MLQLLEAGTFISGSKIRGLRTDLFKLAIVIFLG